MLLKEHSSESFTICKMTTQHKCRCERHKPPPRERLTKYKTECRTYWLLASSSSLETIDIWCVVVQCPKLIPKHTRREYCKYQNENKSKDTTNEIEFRNVSTPRLELIS